LYTSLPLHFMVVLFSSFAMITLLVGADKDASLKAPLKNEESIVGIVRLQLKYEGLVH